MVLRLLTAALATLALGTTGINAQVPLKSHSQAGRFVQAESALLEKPRNAPAVQAQQAQPQRVPIIFYLAKGEANACGEGCNEWIAADGYIDLGAAQRLKTFLTRNAGRNLPIYFSSPGGILSDALAIGRLLHERGMTAGIGNTVPLGCMGVPDKETACRALKRSNGEIVAELRSMGASCNSACVYAFLGAKVRQVPPAAQLGVHSGRLVRVAVDGRVKTGPTDRSAASQKAKTAEFEAQLRIYTDEMGVDPALLDLALKTPFEHIHFLSRDEIAGFGIDTRLFQETRWAAANNPQAPVAVFKLLTEAKGSAGKEFRTSFIRLVCRNSSLVSLNYVRGLASSEVGQPTAITVTAGDRNLTFPRARGEFKYEAIDTGATFDTRQLAVPIEFFESAAAGESIDITETGAGAQPERVSKLSTIGLRGALEALRQECNAP